MNRFSVWRNRFLFSLNVYKYGLCTVFCCPVYCIALHCPTQFYIVRRHPGQFFNALQCTKLTCIVLRCTAFSNTIYVFVMCCYVSYWPVLSYVDLHCIVLHSYACIVLDCWVLTFTLLYCPIQLCIAIRCLRLFELTCTVSYTAKLGPIGSEYITPARE